jgi:hypothetical protein
MGAALTYARRYALFTLVGIAGEDDLDARDLCDRPLSPSVVEPSVKPKDGRFRMPPARNGYIYGNYKREIPATLDSDQSAELREKLLIELKNVTSADRAANWAQEKLASKNRLIAADAKLVEDAFEHRLSDLAPSETAEAANETASTTNDDFAGAHEARAKANSDLDQSSGIDKSRLAIATPRRRRSPEHLRFVAQQPCLVCGRKQSDPHHLRYLQPRALGRKVSDEFALPLCRFHHPRGSSRRRRAGLVERRRCRPR